MQHTTSAPAHRIGVHKLTIYEISRVVRQFRPDALVIVSHFIDEDALQLLAGEWQATIDLDPSASNYVIQRASDAEIVSWGSTESALDAVLAVLDGIDELRCFNRAESDKFAA